MRIVAALLSIGLAAAALAGPPPAGFALDEDGAPIAGARVEAFAVREGFEEPAATWDEVLDPARRPRTPDRAATCGADGRARVEGLDPRLWTFVASAPGRAVDRRTVVVPGFRGPLRLAPRTGRALEGRVVDQHGAPVAGALVAASWGPWVFGADRPELSPFHPWTHADADGRWRLDAVPDGLVEIHASPPGVWTDSARSAVTDDVRRLDLEIPKYGPIVGTVRDVETGKPVPGAVVEVEGRLGWTGEIRTRAVADAAGRYVVPHWPARGFMQVSATAPGRLSAVRQNNVEIALPEDAPLTFDAAVREGATLHGRVLDGGRPVAGAHVWLEEDGWIGTLATTDAAGRYAFPAMTAGPRSVGVVRPDARRAPGIEPRAPGDPIPAGVRPITLPERGDVELDLTLPPPPGPRVSGVVVDENDERVRYAEIVLSDGGKTQSDADGFFEAPRAGDGVLVLTASQEGLKPLRLGGLSAGLATAERPLVVRLERQSRLRVRGVVRDADGKPVRRARAALRPFGSSDDWQRNPLLVRTNEFGEWTPLGPDGSFDLSMDDADEPNVDLLVTAPGRAPACFPVPFATDGDVRDLEVRLAPGATIRGRVVSAATKKPVAGARVVLFPKWLHFACGGPSPATYASTDADGAYVIHDLPACEVEMTALAPGFGEDVRIVRAGGGDGVADFALPARGETFRNGRVPSWIGPPRAVLVDEGDAPLAGWTVEGYADADRTRLDARTLVRATTDAEGKFEFPGTRRVEHLLAYPPAGAKGGPREPYPPCVPPYGKDDSCRLYEGEIVSFEVVDEDGAVATDLAYTIDVAGRHQWSEKCDGRRICMNDLSDDARVTIHVEKPGCEPIDLADVPAGTARMRLVLVRKESK